MSILSNLPGAISIIISLINTAYLSVIAALWYYSVYFGLAPRYSYPVSISSQHSFIAFYGYLYNSVYTNIAAIIILGGSLLLIATNSFGRAYSSTTFLYRMLFAFSASFFSFQIGILILRLSRVLFLQIWTYPGVNWYSLFSVGSTLEQIRLSGHTDPFFEVMEFLLLSVYFVGTGGLLSVLEIRQAIVIFLLLTLPLFSLLFMVKGLEGYAIKFWKLFIEISFLPFFILIELYGIHLFPANFLLQLAFILIAASSPYLLVTANSVFSSGLSTMISSGDVFSSPVSTPIKLLNPARAGIRTAGLGLLGSGSKGESGPVSLSNSRNSRNNVFEEEMMRDFEYRRF